MVDTKKCKICGKIFKRPYIKKVYSTGKHLMPQKSWDIKIYCSKKCLHESQRTIKRWKKKQKCKNCGKIFIKTQAVPNRLFCSSRCSGRYNRKTKKYSERYINSRRKGLSKKYGLSLKRYNELTKKCHICPIDKCVGLHHIISKKDGGKDEEKNYLPLCWNCHKFIHSGMSIKEIKEYYKKLGMN